MQRIFILLSIFLFLWSNCLLDKKERPLGENSKLLEIIAPSGLRLRKDFKSEKDIVELLPVGSKVYFVENSYQYEYRNERIGTWIKVKSENQNVGWIFSAFTKQIYSFDNIFKGKLLCKTIISNSCFLTTTGYLLKKDSKEESDYISYFLDINDQITIEKISEDKDWAYVHLDSNSQKKGWIKFENLAQEKILDIFSYNSNEDEKSIYIVNRGKTNLNTYTNKELKATAFATNGKRFHVKGKVKADSNLYYGKLEIDGKRGVETHYGFLHKETLIPFNTVRNLLKSQNPYIFGLFQFEYGSEKLKSTGDDNCSWSYYEGLSLEQNELKLSIGAWYQVDTYELFSIKENIKNKSYSLYILPTSQGNAHFSRFKFQDNVGSINLKILNENNISLDNEIYIKNRKPGGQINNKCN